MPAKQDNEITVKIKGSMEDFIANIKEKGFKLIEEFKMEDAYFIPKSLKLNEMTCREILAKAILVRYIENFTENIETKLITFKRKEIDKSGVILNQEILNSYNIPIYTDNYFVKKAEVELEKELKNRKI